jgi:transcriptional regulator with XRE-family HTH domain
LFQERGGKQMKYFEVLRRARSLTLFDIQQQTGVSLATLSRFENGKLELSQEHKDKLHSLFYDEDQKKLFSNLDFGKMK